MIARQPLRSSDSVIKTERFPRIEPEPALRLCNNHLLHKAAPVVLRLPPMLRMEELVL